MWKVVDSCDEVWIGDVIWLKDEWDMLWVGDGGVV